VALRAIHHVQLAMPRGGEDQARAYYGGVLGLSEVAKPDELAARGGCWFEQGDLRIHLGVEEEFRPARKAHPAIIVDDLWSMLHALDKEPNAMIHWPNGALSLYLADPFGNRIELIQPDGEI
jgi:catechol 2,3-dioxygenase-like lactoylglutathione lyase family enzyme